MYLGSVIYEGRDLELYGYAEPYKPAVWTLPNGDPGYPAEGGVELEQIFEDGVDVSGDFNDREWDELTELIQEQCGY